MAFATTTTTQASVPVPTNSTTVSGGDAALLLMGALAGASMSKQARRQYRAMTRKMAWQQLGMSFKGLFNKKYRQEKIGGLSPLAFWLIVAGVSLLGILLFGFWGFLVIAALGLIIYLLIKKS
jgi:hypothetical protein